MGVGVVVYQACLTDSQRVVDVSDILLYVFGTFLNQLAGFLLLVCRLYHLGNVSACCNHTIKLVVLVSDRS